MFAPQETTPNSDKIIGRYNVEIARWSQATKEWMPTMPPLYASLTAHSLILQTQTRKRYEPAVIPLSHIKRIITTVDRYTRRVVILHLKSDYYISFYTSRSHVGKDFLAHMRLVTMPSPVVFQSNLESLNLKRLIHFVEKL